MTRGGEAARWIRALGLRPHPEGGWFRETYRARETVHMAALPPRFGGARALGTCIYFLIERPQVSRLHRLRADEVWHLYAGGPLNLHLLLPDGEYRRLRLGTGAEGDAAASAGSAPASGPSPAGGGQRPVGLPPAVGVTGAAAAAIGPFQAVVPAGCWFGAAVDEPGTFALAGCTLAPGFDEADFELGEREALLARFPQHAALIMALTEPGRNR